MIKNKITEQLILDELTNDGGLSIDYCYILDDQLQVWNPSGYICCYLIDDNNLYRACLAYVEARGASFKTIEELLKWARDHNWEDISSFCIATGYKPDSTQNRT